MSTWEINNDKVFKKLKKNGENLMHAIKLILFDLDGTLVDTLKDLAVSTNHVLRTHGYPEHPIEAYKYFVGNGVYKLIERALPEHVRSEEEINRLKGAFIAYYDAHLTDYTKPYEGILETIEKLKDKGIQMAVVTNKPHEQALRVVAACFKPHTFVEVWGQREGIPHKPDPKVIQEIMKKYDIMEDEVLYIGDSDVDMQTAHNAKIKGLGASWGFRTEGELIQNGAWVVLQKNEDILKYT